ncbi:flagellar FlbD family protein [Tumebacillus sp. DT12]|uniref:Flagellar FlbD family protein n=1 Tax=Tumebacillus lacus TaxID=2995335 RepID=A0ABT3WXV9_9BACL|nr:flagellar FlbD family protein [Tumebacillus lacus]MCX7568523.1 flagellar FlbD family protein [Tumebacillus lacus]
MIRVTKFNRSVFYLNATLIETVESTPDTVVTLTTGRKFIVLDSIEDVLKQVELYYRSIGLVGVQIQQKAEGSDVSE